MHCICIWLLSCGIGIATAACAPHVLMPLQQLFELSERSCQGSQAQVTSQESKQIAMLAQLSIPILEPLMDGSIDGPGIWSLYTFKVANATIAWKAKLRIAG